MLKDLVESECFEFGGGGEGQRASPQPILALAGSKCTIASPDRNGLGRSGEGLRGKRAQRS